jgi:hypothetical protein
VGPLGAADTTDVATAATGVALAAAALERDGGSGSVGCGAPSLANGLPPMTMSSNTTATAAVTTPASSQRVWGMTP